MNKFFKNFLTLVSILFNKLLKRPDFSEKKIFLQGKILENQNLKKEKINDLGEIEFSVFSQFGEDGIISWLSNQIPDIKKIFLEIGTQDYWESNTRYLLKSQQWKGYIIEGSKEYVQKIKKQSIYWQNNLTAINEFITEENINEIIKNNVKETNLGLFSLDIDGNDYWILKKLELTSDIVVLEYNPIFGDIYKLSIIYESDFDRNKKHFSNTYFGCSIQAIINLMERKNYVFLGTNTHGMNAFFVNKNKYHHLKDKIANIIIFPPKIREARNNEGKLNFKNIKENLNIIKNFEVYDIDENKIRKLSDYNDLFSDKWNKYIN